MATSHSIHITNFSRQVQTMDQTNSKRLNMTAEDARNLHAEIFALLARIADLTERQEEPETVVLSMDGGGFTSKS